MRSSRPSGGRRQGRTASLPGGRAALIVAHPGHELRVHRWLEVARPQVFVLTDGSGSLRQPRLASTSLVLENVGARAGCVYGRMTDREAYAAILGRDVARFVGLARELAEALVREGVDYVAGDAVEGFNPAHDVCHLLTSAAVELARRSRRSPLPRFDFPLEGRPDECPHDARPRAIWLRLDEAALARKLAATEAYPALASEVARTIATFGLDPFRVECLRPRAPNGLDATPPADPPYYETYGAERVAAGHYERVIRYREHMLPLAMALRDYVGARPERTPAV